MKWESHRNGTPFWEACCHQPSQRATVPTSMATSMQHPCPTGPCPCPAQPGEVPLGTGCVSPDRLRAHQGTVPCAPHRLPTHPKPRASRPAAQQAFSAPFLFAVPQNGASQRQALQELSANPRPVTLRRQPLAAHLTPTPPGPTEPARLGPNTPSVRAGTHRSRRGLSCTRQDHWLRATVSMASGATDRASG